MSPKIRVGVLCGGRSGEHEVSLISAKSIISAIDRDKYDVEVIGIKKDGSWNLMDEENFLVNPDDPAKVALANNGKEIVISPAPGKDRFRTKDKVIELDVIFPALHGTFGEDGTLQGMLEMLGIPYVGADYMGSAAAMDKDVSKRLFREAGLPVVDCVIFTRSQRKNMDEAMDKVEARLKYPVFVKPANLGSSVGINKAVNRKELKDALDDAWLYDTKILVEQGVNAREIECALLGNEHVEASELGEIIPRHAFYSYEAKYIDPDGAKLIVGVKDIDPDIKKKVQEIAIKAFKTLGCEGMARADFFVEKGTDKIFLNELNTIPGFTKISMYPKLWEKSGVPYPKLIDRLIQLAFDRHHARSSLKTEFKCC